MRLIIRNICLPAYAQFYKDLRDKGARIISSVMLRLADSESVESEQCLIRNLTEPNKSP